MRKGEGGGEKDAQEVLAALGEAETKEKAPISSIFEDVYSNTEELTEPRGAAEGCLTTWPSMRTDSTNCTEEHVQNA